MARIAPDPKRVPPSNETDAPMGPRVLIVDADLMALRAAVIWLREAGYETTAVPTFVEARAALDRGSFDILVADLRLGAFNGIHLVLLARHRTPGIRAIVTHTPANAPLEDEARRAGADEFLVKPLTRAVLLEAVGPPALPLTAVVNKPRRWPRVRLAESCEGRIENADARVLDVSYGGVRVEVAETRSRDVGSLVRLEILQPPLAIHVRPIWLQTSSPGVCWYGAEIADPDPAAAGRWRSFVDSVSAA